MNNTPLCRMAFGFDHTFWGMLTARCRNYSVVNYCTHCPLFVAGDALKGRFIKRHDLFRVLLLFTPNVKGKWVDSNFQIIDRLVPPRVAGVAGTLIFFHIANFATLQPWLHVGSFTCRILIHCIRTRDPYFYVPLRDTELCD